MAHDVFISYSAKDKLTADAACTSLEAQGVRCWIAPRDAAPGEPWAASIVAAIQASRVMVLIFSARSNDSENVLREVSSAAEAGLPILTLRVEDAQPSRELGYYIRRAHWLDALTPPLEAHLRTLGDSVRGLLAGPAREAAPGSGGAPEPEPMRVSLARALETRRRRALALGALLVVALGGATYAWLRRSATLAIESEPADAVATLDGVAVGSTPLALSVASGSHAVLVRRPGFKDWSKVIDVSPGDKASFSFQLIVADSRDAAAVNLLALPLGVALQQFTLPETQRVSMQGEPVELIVPRGRVRLVDVTTLLMDIDPERVDPSGVIALRRGATTLWEAPFQPQAEQYAVPVPQTVRALLRPGEQLIWGWWPSQGRPVTVALQVVSDDVAPLMAELERRLGEQPEAVRRHLHAQALLDHELFTGAFLEARVLALEDPGDVRAVAVMEQALTSLDGGELRAVAGLRSALLSAPEAERAKVFGAVPAGTHR